MANEGEIRVFFVWRSQGEAIYHCILTACHDVSLWTLQKLIQKYRHTRPDLPLFAFGDGGMYAIEFTNLLPARKMADGAKEGDSDVRFQEMAVESRDAERM
jgi:hypothetical protein